MDKKSGKLNVEQPEETSERLFDLEPAELVLRQHPAK